MKSLVLPSNKSRLSVRRLPSLAALIVASVAASGNLSSAQAQNNTVFKSVVIDVTGIPAGAGFAREQMKACLSRYVPENFAGRINPSARNAPVLVVRPIMITLINGDSTEGGGGGGSDTLQGEAVVGGTRIPLTVSAASGSAGDSLAVAVAAAGRRTDALCQSFAYWLARKI